MKNNSKKPTEIANSQAGVIGNGTKIDGGVHFHNHHYSSSEILPGETPSAEFKESIQKSEQPQANILHLSDLHFGTADDAQKWYSQLADDLTLELECSTLDALILSGDIANMSEPGEYDAAKDFIDRLCKGFGLAPGRLVIVPGNHDLNWKLAKKGYSLIDLDEYEGELVQGKYIEVSNDVVRLRDEKEYKLRFQHFSRFYEAVKGRPYPSGYASQGVFTHIPDLNLLIAGFNSAWELDHHFKTRASICPDAVTHALDRLREKDEFRNSLKFAVWHHPLSELAEQEFMQRFAQCGFSVCFHGHIHKADTGLYKYDQNINGRKISLVGAGTFGAPVREWVPGYPLQYNLIRISGRTLTVETRCRRELNGAWKPDAIWTQGPGEDPLPRYFINLPEEAENITCNLPDTEKRILPLEIPELYQRWLIDICQHMDIDKLRERGRVIQVNLPEIFIPLFANPPEDGKKKTVEIEGILGDRERTADIEDLITENDYLLIEGEAGSGKTTMVRHFAYMMVKNGGWKGLEGWLPVILFLKDLKDFKCKEPAAGTAENILAHYAQVTGSGLDVETVKHFCRQGNALFLIDGLDEADRSLRDMVVNALAGFRREYPGCKIVLSGRSHGLEGSVIENFGKRHVKIQPLTMKQVEDFITRWFEFIFDEESKIGKRTAQSMISEITDHPGVERLIDNPLMLTAVCILYYDERELPSQRAELYKKFVDNLLYRRFDEPEKVHRFLTSLAFYMHHDLKKRSIDRCQALNVLEQVYKFEQEDESQYLLESKFDRIEPDCGLLKLESGQYMFRHLTFQEFLTAIFLVEKERKDYSKAIHDFWDDERYKEVIELYIGYLSIHNSGVANEIVREILNRDDNDSFNRWRLACRALLDIHEDRRDASVVELARGCLEKIIYSEAAPKDRAEAGETLGWLGDHRDLKEFIKIKGGKYELSMGTFEIEEFEIGKYPVTNGWFAEFVEAGGYKDMRWWTEEGKKWLEYSKAECPRYWHDRQWNCPNKPVVGVCWYEADAFAKWLTDQLDDGRKYILPDENQWEAAGAGFNKREYPWGEWKEDHCNSEEAGFKKTSAVGIFRKGDSSEGVCDLSGNVWEFTCTDYHSEQKMEDFEFKEDILMLWSEWENESGKRKDELQQQIVSMLQDKDRQFPVFRGGSWGDGAGYCRVAIRSSYDPGNRDPGDGFRLVLALPGQ